MPKDMMPICPKHGPAYMKFAGGPEDSPLKGNDVWYCTKGWDLRAYGEGYEGGEKCDFRYEIPWPSVIERIEQSERAELKRLLEKYGTP